MQKRLLGNTGLEVSALGLGGIPIQRMQPADVASLLSYLAEHGVNYIDTARGYTVSEQLLGNALCGSLRRQFHLASKSMSRDYTQMMQEIDTSLRLLRTDHISIYQLHNIKSAEEFEQAFSEHGAAAAILDAIQAGKVGHLGASTHSVDAFARLLSYREVETIMFPLNLVEQQGEALMQQAVQQQVGIIAMKPMAGGCITDARLALGYLMQHPSCTIAIPGMGSIDEARQNIAACENPQPFTAQEQARIEELRRTLSGSFCRRCGYCLPCSAGIDIPSCFLLQGYLQRYDLANWARTRYQAAAVKASACIHCGSCERRCPYELPIREKLKSVVRDFEQAAPRKESKPLGH